MKNTITGKIGTVSVAKHGSSIPRKGMSRFGLILSMIGIFVLISISGYAQTYNQQGPKLVDVGASVNSYQGSSVALSADGNTCIVGGYAENSYNGAAWVYTRDHGTWTLQQKLDAVTSDGSSYQGWAVAISADGNSAVVGGPGYQGFIGAAWTWTRSGGTWTEGQLLQGSDADVGGNNWQGNAVAISGDGLTIMFGGFLDNAGEGASWAFAYSAGTWSQVGSKLVGSNDDASSYQGSACALSYDGTTGVATGYYDNGQVGAAWIWTFSAGTWSQEGAKLVASDAVSPTQMGYSAGISYDGNTVVVGGYQDNSFQGAAWVFQRSGGTWSQQGNHLIGSGGTPDAFQGIAVGISGDGKTIISGGQNDQAGIGSIWVFTLSGGTWSQAGIRYRGNDLVGSSLMGATASLSADASTIAAGGWEDNDLGTGGQGAAWIFIECSSSVCAVTTSASICSGLPFTLCANAGSELSFDGVNDYVQVSHDAALDAYPLTVSTLVKTTSASTFSTGIVNKYVSGSFNGYNVYMSNGHVFAYYFKDASNYCFDFVGGYGIDGGIINDGVWHQITMTVDADGAKLYVDGLLKGVRAWTGTAGACTTTQPLTFGKYATKYFAGDMDEIRIYNTSLNQAAILNHMAIPVSPTTTGLVGYWRFDNGAGLTTTDLTSNSFTGTLLGVPAWVSPSTAIINAGMTYVWGPGTGLSGTTGSAVVASPGSDQTYSITGTAMNGCTPTTTTPVTLHTTTSVSQTTFSDVCVTDAAFTLTGGSPSGGIYSGTGVSDPTFTPATAGQGTWPITYTYTDANRCTGTDSQNQVVNFVIGCVPLTELAVGYRDITESAITDNLYFDWVTNSTNYDIHAVNIAAGFDQTITVGAQTNFRMTSFPGVAFSTVYTVTVRAKVLGVYGAYGTSYTVTTASGPVTELHALNRNITEGTISDHLYIDYVSGATNYDLHATNIASGYDQILTIGAQTDFRMTSYTGLSYSTTYDIEVRAKVSGVYCAYGASYSITTPAGPLTQLSAGYCNPTLTSMGNHLYYDWVSGATNFDVNVTNSGLGYDQTITQGQTTVFYMSQFTGILPSTTYDVKVRAKVSGLWCLYSTVCHVTTPTSSVPTTQLAVGWCNSTLAQITNHIYFDWNSGATNYDVHVVNVATGYDEILSLGPVSVFYLTDLPAGIQYSTTYDITIRTKIGGTWGIYGTMCQITTPAPPIPTTQLALAYRNSTMPNISDHLYFDWVNQATNFDVNVSNTGLAYSQTFTVGATSAFYMTNFTGIQYSTTYDVKIRAKVGGVYGAYGAVYTVTTPPPPPVPPTQLTTANCDYTMSTMSEHLYYDWVQGGTNYDVHVYNTGLSYDQTITLGNVTVFYMTNFTGILYSTTYNVEVRVKVGGVYGAYGSVCTITTPAPPPAPTTHLNSPSYCNITLAHITDHLYYDWIPNATNFDVHVVNVGLGYDQVNTYGASTDFRLSNFPGLTINTTYTVTVRAKVGGTYGSYGSACTITTPPTLSRNGGPDDLGSQPISSTGTAQFLVSAYPNPFSQLLNVNISGEENTPINIELFDMTGRRVSSNDVPGTTDAIILGEGLENGMYILIATQGTNKKTIRVVKSN